MPTPKFKARLGSEKQRQEFCVLSPLERMYPPLTIEMMYARVGDTVTAR